MAPACSTCCTCGARVKRGAVIILSTLLTSLAAVPTLRPLLEISRPRRIARPNGARIEITQWGYKSGIGKATTRVERHRRWWKAGTTLGRPCPSLLATQRRDDDGYERPEIRIVSEVLRSGAE